MILALGVFEFGVRAFYHPTLKMNRLGTAIFLPVALRLAEADRRPVFFIGDSTVGGQESPWARTIPAVVERLLDEAGEPGRVTYNLGLKGSTPTTHRLMLAQTVERAGRYDRPSIVLETHGRWFSRHTLTVKYWLAPMRSVLERGPGVRLADLRFYPSSGVLDLLDIALNRELARVSRLVEFRQALLFELPQRLLGKAYDQPMPPPGDGPGQKLLDRELLLEKIDNHYRDPVISPGNPFYQATVETLDLMVEARGRGVQVLVYVTPVNLEAIGRERPELVESARRSARTLAELVRARDLPLIDFVAEDEFGEELFIDDDHLNDRGVERVARRLADRLRSTPPAPGPLPPRP